MDRNSTFIYILAKTIRFILLPIAKMKFNNKQVWLVSERGTDARDNGYHMFRYLRTEHPEVEAWYIITRDSADLNKISDLGNIAYIRSLDYWLLYISAKIVLTSFAPIVPSTNKRFAEEVIKKNRQKIVFLQHGIMCTDVQCYHQECAKYDMFICGAKPEYDFVSKTFNYSNGEIRYTGLARFDALHNITTKRQILIMPTWRKWLKELSEQEVAQSEYAKRWNHLIRNPKLTEIAKIYNLQIIFYPHQEMQKFTGVFSSTNEKIVIADCHNYDVQPLLRESALLVTDYSSVHFDFAYMKKPVVYYQFDEEEVYKKHTKPGYFDFEQMGFGEKTNVEEDVIRIIEGYVANEFHLKDQYEKRIDGFFPLYDDRNCERIYQEIISTFD